VFKEADAMQKSRVRLGIATLVVLVAASVAVAVAATIPEEVTIADCQSKQAAVEFPHKAHTDKAECVKCHHTQTGLTEATVASTEVQKCGSCHTAPEKAETPKCSEMSLTKNPYHIGCINCHKEELKKNAEAKAPTKCTDCHPKAA
jgi:hypothetical protein